MQSAKNYETFEHQADIGIRGRGRSLEESFENAAMALYSVMLDVKDVKQSEKKDISVTAPDPEMLLVEWLIALLTLSDQEQFFFSRFEVKISNSVLSGTAWGERFDKSRHRAGVEVKGAIYHLLSVVEHNGAFTAQCVVDV